VKAEARLDFLFLFEYERDHPSIKEDDDEECPGDYEPSHEKRLNFLLR